MEEWEVPNIVKKKLKETVEKKQYLKGKLMTFLRIEESTDGLLNTCAEEHKGKEKSTKQPENNRVKSKN